MENLKKVNGVLGGAIVEVNKSSDEEIDSFMNVSLGQIRDIFCKIPERFCSLKVSDLLSIYELAFDDADAETIGAFVMNLFGINPETASDEEMSEIQKDFDELFKLMDSLD